MKQTIGFCAFCDAFRDMDRNENFSYDGKRALFDYLEEYEESTGEEIELDVIALCCDYNESTYEEIAEDYMFYQPHGESEELKEFKELPEDEQAEIVEEYLNDHTMVVGAVSGGFVYAAF